jgi:hypothetical protein
VLGYDRTRALLDGRVTPDGIDLVALSLRQLALDELFAPTCDALKI